MVPSAAVSVLNLFCFGRGLSAQVHVQTNQQVPLAAPPLASNKPVLYMLGCSQHSYGMHSTLMSQQFRLK
ncbi:hypothetical protein ABBQ32_005120 [Trebouxia sp. C0010 RCD-2024]